MATNAAWVTALGAMTVTGVTRHYANPPQAVSTADLPVYFPMAPGGGMPAMVLSCKANNKVRRAQVVILVEPVGQATNAINFGKLAALMDALETSLDALTTANLIEYDMQAGVVVNVAGTDYWAISASVTGREI